MNHLYIYNELQRPLTYYNMYWEVFCYGLKNKVLIADKVNEYIKIMVQVKLFLLSCWNEYANFKFFNGIWNQILESLLE